MVHLYQIRTGFPLKAKFFRIGTGNEPVREWLKSLPKEERKLIGEDIKTVQYSWPIGMPLARKLTGEIWEVRSNLRDKISRVLFTILDNQIILLHGFMKKTQKTPKEDLNLAIRRMRQAKKGKHMKRLNKHIGSDFDNFLKGEGILEEAQAAAAKKIIALQIWKIMKERNFSKSRMALRMRIKSRTQLDRLLDVNNSSVTLLTLEKAANALGKHLEVNLV